VPEILKNANNLYFVTYRNLNPNAYLKDGKNHLVLPVLSPDNQIPIGNDPLDFMIEIGDEKNPANTFIILYVKDVKPEELEVYINKSKASFHKSTEDGLVIFKVTGNSVLPGMNSLSVKKSDVQSTGSKPTLLDVAILFHRNPDDAGLKELSEVCFQ
jgi:hypothetical protein